MDTIDARFVRYLDGHEPRYGDFGVSFADYFKDDGWARAVAVADEDPATANMILCQTYRGKDAGGVHVEWTIWDGSTRRGRHDF